MRTILISSVLLVGCGKDAESASAKKAETQRTTAQGNSAATRKADVEAKTDAGRNDASKLEGKWALASANSDGRDWAKGRFAGWYYVFKDGKVTNIVGGPVDTAKAYKVEASKTPAHLDLPGDNNPKKPPFQAGLYKIDGDTLTICVRSDFQRPTDFNPGEGQTLLTLTRVK
jgi:uncharacterized protein (TIGR03067 family)